MLALVIKGFRDLRAGVYRKAGDVIDVTPERFAEINATAYGSLVTEAPRPKARRTRKAKGE